MNYTFSKEEKNEYPKIRPVNPAVNKPIGTGGASDSGTLAGADKLSGAGGFKNTNENANFGVRSFLENEAGVKSSDIDFDGQSVTLMGEKLLTPEKLSDGRSFVSSADDIKRAIGEYSAKNGVVGIRDYVTGRGQGFDVSWNQGDGTVSINGVSVKPSYIVDGKAYLKQSELDSILENAGGAKSNSQILSDVGARYDADRDKLYSQIVNDKGFSYNPKEDALYQQFIDIYRKSVEDEFNNNMAASRFRTGGVASMGAQASASALREKALENENAYLQEFYDKAYSEYMNNRNNKINALSLIASLKQGDYDLASDASDRDWTRQYQDRLYDMDKRTYEKQLDDDNFERELYRRFAYPLAENELKLSDLGVTAQELSNKGSQKELNWNDKLNLADIYNAIYNGRLSAAETGVPYDLLGALGVNDFSELTALFK